MILFSSAAFLCYLSRVQTDDLTVDPAVSVGVWVLQTAMIGLTIVRWAVSGNECRKPPV